LKPNFPHFNKQFSFFILGEFLDGLLYSPSLSKCFKVVLKVIMVASGNLKNVSAYFLGNKHVLINVFGKCMVVGIYL